MIVLQASVERGWLLLWGESPLGHGEPPADFTPPASPFDSGPEALRNALREVLPIVAARHHGAEPRIAWLPTLAGRPLPSTPLLAEGAAATSNGDSASPTLQPWTVSASLLSPPHTLELLSHCLDRDTLAPGVIIGRTLGFWAQALRLAGAMVAREELLPVVHQEDIGPAGRWEPLFTGPEAKRLADLTHLMPHACWALTESADAPPLLQPEGILKDWLGQMVDQLVRQALAPAVPSTTPKRFLSKTTVTFDSVHDAWLHALRSPDAALPAKPKEIERLVEEIAEWRQPVMLATSAPYRLCFRLEEPPLSQQSEEGEQVTGPWQVRYLLQSTTDPSLLLPASEAFSERSMASTVFRRKTAEIRQYVLTTLGQAASISPPIEQSLHSSVPSGYTLDVTGAHEFLTQIAWQLEQAGFGVLLPAWWTRLGTRLHLTAKANVKSPPMSGSLGLSMDQLVAFDWEMALGEQTLTKKELETLAHLKAPLVRLRGQWVHLTAEQIQAALAFWNKHSGGKLTLREVVQMAMGLGQAPGGIEVGSVRADGWIGSFLDRLRGTQPLEMLPVPAAFQGTLRPYQERGYSWLAFLRQWGLGACLADDMGLGKTVQTLALLLREWERQDPAKRRPALLVCPMSVVGNWQKEAAKFTPELPVMVHHGMERSKGKSFAKIAGSQALVVTSYGLLHRDLEQFESVPWLGVILDEAQNIKNPNTKQSQAARNLKGEFRIALTGTPLENHVGDLWAIMEFLNPGYLGSQSTFKRTFFLPIQATRDVEATERLRRLTSPFTLRRLKTDASIIADLPEKLEMKVYCTLTKEQVSLYQAVVEDATHAIDSATGMTRRGMVLATLSKLKQVCNHPAHFLGDNSALPARSGKLSRLSEMLEEALEEGDKALVFTQFAEMGHLIRRHLQETFGREVLFLHGGVGQKQREEMVTRFQNEPDGPRVLVLSLKAGGVGLNLTAANHVFHFDRWWNPAVENQATDRAFRIGQTRQVQVHKFICVGTLEEKIDEMIERKKAVAASIVGSGEDWLTELSTEQLRELFALRRDAVAE